MKTLGLIDHHDSFCDNLARYFQLLGVGVDQRQSNDLNSLTDIPSTWTHLCIGPGPGSPATVPYSIRMIELAYERLPILGVCLGHQCLAQVFGGNIIASPSIHHGKTSMLSTVPDPLFAGLPSSFRVGRYHSLAVDPYLFPRDLKIIATAQDSGEIMALRHRTYPSVGIQFHPESILTEYGSTLLENFIKSENL